MIAPHSAANRRLGRRLLLSFAPSVLLVSGCSNFVNSAPDSAVAGPAAKVGGRVHGGNQPVAGATVSLYFAGQAGIASPAILAATTTTADDGAGSFTFNKLPDGSSVPVNTGNSFVCPSTSQSASPYVYLVARGGNTLNDHDATKNNTAAVFLAPVGFCSSITASTFTYMSEAVTAATVAAVHQFMNVTTGDIGADGILASYDGLANAFGTVNNLVSLTTGQTIASATLTGSVSGVSVTATPEQAKLNQVGNILSSCVNNATSAAAACVTLFANAVPPASASTTSTPNATFTAATNVLQAAYYMFTNATDSNQTNRTNLYNLATGTGAPYQPTLTAVPSDWSIGVQYVASGNCGTGTARFLNGPYDINIDSVGNIWVANNQVGGATLAELGPTGAPSACIPIPGASHGGTIDSGVVSGSGALATRTPGGIWVGDSQNNNVYRYDTVAQTTLAFPTAAPPYALAADGNGNVYFSTITTPSVYVIPNAAGASAAITPVLISSTIGTTPSRLIVDGNGSLWVSSQQGFVSKITHAAGSLDFTTGWTTVQIPTPSPSYGLAADAGPTSPTQPNNGVYVSSQTGSNQLNLLTGTGTTYASANGFPTAANAGGLNTPSAIAVDGAINVWAANDGTNSPSGLSVVSQFAQNGTSLSADGTTTGGYQKPLSYFVNGRTIAVDQAGNVWVGRDGSQQLTEIVGAGVPIFQPFSLGLAQGRFQTKP